MGADRIHVEFCNENQVASSLDVVDATRINLAQPRTASESWSRDACIGVGALT